MAGLLSGVKVLDLSRNVPGPACSMILNDFGAEVIRVEDPESIDLMRVMGRKADGINYRFETFNRGKRSVALSLKSPRGREVFMRLVEQADVVVEGFRPGVMQRRGLGYEDLRAVNPRLIYCSLSGFGQKGPYGLRGGHDLNYQALAGTLVDSQNTGDAPRLPPVAWGDLAGGTLTAAMSILAGLLSVRSGGEGHYIDASILDGLLLMNIMGAAIAASQGRDPSQGERQINGDLACYNIYQTRDGRHMALGIIEPTFWQAFCQLIERTDLLPFQMDMTRQEYLKAELIDIFAARTRDEWEDLAKGVDCCLEPVYGPLESLRHPQVQSRDHLYEMQSGDKEWYAPGLPRKLAGLSPAKPSAAVQRAPRLGEHTREILLEAGFSDLDIDVLLQEGAVNSG